ncbi:hypothetical protein BRYFOR_09909 [Marvinbryantia formatexigens DSM 14469]|uniref:Uncharacterized protein n=1 Tax=Marvinbryantia formatexigens DSM 14469 TaxID=478749 RepID=C6LMK8_9FIRM|nr:hypothetical protein BRYFOR_09909 [Marvinbryantia formatexigens DSM 14469]
MCYITNRTKEDGFWGCMHLTCSPFSETGEQTGGVYYGSKKRLL